MNQLLEYFPKGLVVCDLETYRNYFLAGFLDVGTGRVAQVEGSTAEARDIVGKIMSSETTLVTFNGNYFDYPLLYAHLYGETEEYLKGIADALINDTLKPWKVLNKYQSFITPHIDLIEIAPASFSSLKAYGARMNMKRLQDLPIEHTAEIKPEERELIRQYNRNDLETTLELLRRLEQEVILRVNISQEQGVDVRSKSDAQIAEHVLCHRLGITKARITPPASVRYRKPHYVEFQNDDLKLMLSKIEESSFAIDKTGHVVLPDFLSKSTVSVGEGVYQMGVGGLHSKHDKSVCHVSDGEYVVIDFDVTSFYPNIMLNQQLNPPHIGSQFCRVFQSVVDARIAAKRSGDKVKADTLKIVVNSSFGHLANRWSRLYAPEQMLAVVLSGQLTLLMLIEILESCGVQVVSANTDGIVIKVHKDLESLAREKVREFGVLSNFEFEDTPYRAIALKDCNNYIAIKKDRSVKGKGLYEKPNLKKNVAFPICAEAVKRWLSHGIPFFDTIRKADFVDFLSARTVNGGGIQGGSYLGRVVRWYQSTDRSLSPLVYQTNGNKVPKSEGARACMDLPDEMPSDIDHEWYLKECILIAKAIGCVEYLTESELKLVQPPPKVRKARGASKAKGTENV